jgi:hypothetical protein
LIASQRGAAQHDSGNRDTHGLPPFADLRFRKMSVDLTYGSVNAIAITVDGLVNNRAVFLHGVIDQQRDNGTHVDVACFGFTLKPVDDGRVQTNR